MNMTQYIYEIKHNNILKHTSPLFSSLQAAYQYFMEQDAPNRYSNIKFKQSNVVSSALVNNLFKMDDIIRVQFKKVESEPVSNGEWSDLCEKEDIANEW